MRYAHAVIAVLGLLAVVQFESAAAEISVGSPVQVTLAKSNTPQWETTICTNPLKPNELAVGAMYDQPSADYLHDVAFYTSRDGGKSWQLALDDHHRADPACVFGQDGTLYATDMVAHGRGLQFGGMLLRHSSDLGRTWKAVYVHTKALGPHHYPWFDREWLAAGGNPPEDPIYFNVIQYFPWVDADGQEHYQGDAPEISLFRWTKSSGTLSESTARVTPQKTATHPGQVGVLSDGTVVHAFFSWNGKFYVTTSRDGGQTISPFRQIGGFGKATSEPKHQADFHYIPMVAVDQSNGPYRDRVYVVWTEPSSGRVQVWLTHSLDRHANVWTTAHPLDDAQAFDLKKLWLGPNDCNPAIAVNKSGVAGLLWADRRDSRSGGYWPRFTASFDGGETWTKSERFGNQAARMRNLPRHWEAADYNDLSPEKNRPLLVLFTAAKAPPFEEPTDHWGLAADAGGVFHAVWLDGSTGVDQVWTATVSVSGNAHQSTEVTDNIKIVFGSHDWDPQTHLAWVDVGLLNISNAPITGQLVLKSIDPAEDPSFNLPPRETNLRALNADNGWPGPGAFWTFNANGSGRLPPGASTQFRRLEFRTLNPKLEDTLGARVFAEGNVSTQ